MEDNNNGGILGSKPLFDPSGQQWGQFVPAHGGHITQTNEHSHDGLGAHVTTHLPGSQGASVHDRFSPAGDFMGSNFGLPNK